MRIEIQDVQEHILKEIADKRLDRATIATTYYFCILSSEKPDFAVINAAIIARFGASGLQWIKERAWEDVREKLRHAGKVLK